MAVGVGAVLVLLLCLVLRDAEIALVARQHAFAFLLQLAQTLGGLFRGEMLRIAEYGERGLGMTFVFGVAAAVKIALRIRGGVVRAAGSICC